MSYYHQGRRGGNVLRRSYPRGDDYDGHRQLANKRYRQNPAYNRHPIESQPAADGQPAQYRVTGSKQSGYYYQPKQHVQAHEHEHGQESQEESYESHECDPRYMDVDEHYDYDYDYEHYQPFHDTSSCGNYMELRSRDTTRNIRDMNNWCKYVNITHSIREAFGENGEHRINILDLGCGKGGDLYKCRGNKKYIHKYLGIDISEECVFAARRKYERILQENIKHRNAPHEERKKFGLNNAYGQTAKEFYDGSFFDAQFICNDMTSPDLHEQKLIVQHRPFHLINIQFALHYAFQTHSALMALLKTIASATKPGSYFICSFVRDELMIKRLSESLDSGTQNDGDSISFQNEFQWLRMKKTDLQFIRQRYDKHNLLHLDVNELYEKKQSESQDDEFCQGLVGIPYQYFQRDSVEGDQNGGVQEFFISFACFV
eukprot:CAMPEP_0197023684 /NCGR_PEP_ID=MMETSP1384-20130603/4349_1 /TAXON_ID=29189 /ORGANISM="Ammonia sp." /LENGTH=429 /DNA_ID=CAMNT_0042451935 /DNA_START=905 /DNA_END=2193 /DNA_ORIENTATION=+